MISFKSCLLGLCCLATVTNALASLTVHVYATSKSGDGISVGDVIISETKYGLLFSPHLHDLKPGLHGFHIHQNPSCAQEGMEAGGHLDPSSTNQHLGPYSDDGHLGDLPVLAVAADGQATVPVLAPRLQHLTDIQQHALMIHDGGDNYSDVPAKLGGGGSRMECGVIAAADVK